MGQRQRPQPPGADLERYQPAHHRGKFDLRSVDGPARPGDYVAITVLGAAQVKVQPGETLKSGQRVTVGADGAVRALDTRTLDGMLVSEGAPTVGVVLKPAGNGMVWVLVNP